MGHCGAAVPGDVGGDLSCCVWIAAVDHDTGAVLRQVSGDGRPDSARTTHDHGAAAR